MKDDPTNEEPTSDATPDDPDDVEPAPEQPADDVTEPVADEVSEQPAATGSDAVTEPIDEISPPAAESDDPPVESSSAAADYSPPVELPPAEGPSAQASPPPPPEATHPAGPPTPQRSGRGRVLAGVGALVLAAAAGVGIGRATADDSDSPERVGASDRDDDDRDGGRDQDDRDHEMPGRPDFDDEQHRGGPLENIEEMEIGVGGTVSDVSDDGFTLETDFGADVEVTTDDDTVVTDTRDGSLGDLQAGDAVRISGDQDDDSLAADSITASDDDALLDDSGSWNAGGVAVEVPDVRIDGPLGEFGVVGGTIESIDGNTLTVTTDDGETVEVTTDDDTTVQVVSEISVGDLADGDDVTVFGEDFDGDALTATSIRRGDLDTPFGEHGGWMPPTEPGHGGEDGDDLSPAHPDNWGDA